MMYITSPKLIHLITGSLYFWPPLPIIPKALPLTSDNHQFVEDILLWEKAILLPQRGPQMSYQDLAFNEIIVIPYSTAYSIAKGWIIRKKSHPNSWVYFGVPDQTTECNFLISCVFSWFWNTQKFTHDILRISELTTHYPQGCAKYCHISKVKWCLK